MLHVSHPYLVSLSFLPSLYASFLNSQFAEELIDGLCCVYYILVISCQLAESVTGLGTHRYSLCVATSDVSKGSQC